MPGNRNKNRDDAIPTRASLLSRLKDWQDQASWQDFFDTYWKLIYTFARKRGLTDSEAQDVVQDTMISVARQIPGFKYNPALGSFKTWLLNMTQWRITDQLRKRNHAARPDLHDGDPSSFIERAADPSGATIDRIWEDEWQKNLLDAALERVRRRLDPERYQVFDVYVNKGWPPGKVAKTFSISVAQVYLAKHRVMEMIRKEVARLEREML
ncbi:MAG TPA: sigma-70 family RNA polymerase sigma factor [Verrucomicrobiota bacterium]|nr:sigma-70 family RNA polymerase sigma factor [Verrucomicrobiota bacterium]